MADGGNVQHIAELGFDLSGIQKQFEQLDQMVVQQGIRLNELARQNWNLEATINVRATTGTDAQQQMAQATQQVNAALQQQLQAINSVNTALGTQEQSSNRLTEAYNSQAQSVGRLHTNTTSLVSTAGRLLGIYSGLSLANKAIRESAEAIREVETRMMEISRIMELTTQQSNSLRDSLFSTATQMGRDFESTSEIMLRFAQAGYNVAESTEMTRTALLAMNTAELDAANSANSMIGILQQWGYEANELETVIDKLNYTADNNAVTTQDLVDSLLRSSSAAKNAKISFDELVGVTVALREATGRTGKELGTAVNSLIAFTTRAKSVSVFEDLGVTVWLDEQKTAMNSVMDIWSQLSTLYRAEGEKVISVLASQTDMTELYSQEVAEAAGATDTYNQMLETQVKLQGELNDAERLDLTSQFGVYRRNYAIALLENFEKIAEVTAEMDDSIGHSARENARYMETLDAKIKQLITSLQELAVQAGEAGLLDLAKGAVTALTAVTNFTKGIGGLVPVLITLTGLMTALRSQQIAGYFTDVSANATRAVASLRSFATGMTQTAAATTQAGNAISASAIGLTGWIGVITLAIGVVWQAVSAIKAKAEAQRQAAIATAQANSDEIQSLKDLRAEYESMLESTDSDSEKTEALNEWKRKLIETYKVEKDAIDKVNLSRETGINLIDEEISKRASETLGQLGSGYLDAVSKIESAQRDYLSTFQYAIGGMGDFYDTSESIGRSVDAFKELGVVVKEIKGFGAQEAHLGLLIESDSLTEQVRVLDGMISQLTKLNDLSEAERALLDELEKKRNSYTATLENNSEAYEKGNEAMAIVKLQEYTTGVNDIANVTEESFEAWREGLIKTAGESKGLANVLEDMAYDLFPQYKKSVDNTSGAMGNIADIFNKATDEATSLSEALKTLQDNASLVSDLMENGITAKNLDQIIQKYADLDDEVAAYLVGLMSEAELIDIIAAKHSEDATAFEESVQAKLLSSEAFYQVLLDNESDLLNELADKYSLDLSNYIDVLRGKLIAQGEATGEMAMASAGLITELARQYEIDIENFASAEEFKAAMAAAIANDINNSTAEGIISLAEKYGVDVSNYIDALRTKLITHGATETSIIGGTAEGVIKLAEQYGIDVQNFEDAENAKIAIANAARAQMEEDFKRIKEVAGSYTPKPPEVSGGSASATKGQTQAEKDLADAIKGTTDAINDKIKALQDELKEFESTHKAEIDLLKEQKQAEDAAHKAAIDRLKERKKAAAQAYKDEEAAVKSRYDAEIQRLRDLKTETSREDARADYEKSRAELEAELAEQEMRTGREATERIKEIDKALAELDESERRRQRDVDIDNQIAALEATRDAEIAAIQAAAEAEDERYERRIKNRENEQKADQAAYEEKIKTLEEMIKFEQEKYENDIKMLKDELEEVKKSTQQQSEAYTRAYNEQMKKMNEVGANNKTVAKESNIALEEFYRKATINQKNFSDPAIKDAKTLWQIYQDILALMDEIEDRESDSSSDRSSSSSSSRSVNIPSMDTGGFMLSDGLIYAHRGEAIVREDITRGLLRIIDKFKVPTTQNLIVRSDITDNINRASEMMQAISNISNYDSSSYDNSSNPVINIHLEGSTFGAGTSQPAFTRNLSRDITDILNKLPR